MFLSEFLNLVLCSQVVLGALCGLDNVLQSAQVNIKILTGPTCPEVPKSHSFPLYPRNMGWCGLKGTFLKGISFQPPGMGRVTFDWTSCSEPCPI